MGCNLGIFVPWRRAGPHKALPHPAAAWGRSISHCWIPLSSSRSSRRGLSPSQHTSSTGVRWMLVNRLVLHHLPACAMPGKPSLSRLWMLSRTGGQKGRAAGGMWHPGTQAQPKQALLLPPPRESSRAVPLTPFPRKFPAPIHRDAALSQLPLLPSVCLGVFLGGATCAAPGLEQGHGSEQWDRESSA